jgi:hypothetical protein
MNVKRYAKWLVVVALVGALVWGLVRCNQSVDIDVCLDRGGVWNDESKTCEGVR